MSNKKLKELKNVKLTVEKLKQFEGFENISNEEAENVIWSLKRLSEIYFDCFQKQIQNKC